MKRFLFSVGLFLGLFAVMNVALFVMIRHTLVRKSQFPIDESTRYVVLGPSHSQCAFNDEMIDRLQNFSRSGEAYCYAYAKLKCIMMHNKPIDTVFVELTSRIIKDNKKWLWSEEYLRHHYAPLGAFLSYEENKVLFNGHIVQFFKTMPFFIAKGAYTILNGHYDVSCDGGFKKLTRVVNTTVNQPSNSDEYIGNYVQLFFLDKIVQCCRDNGVTLVFIRCPIHPKAGSWRHENEFQTIRMARFPEIVFWDYGATLISDEYFGDYYHLNYNGAIAFSKIINDRINKIDK